MAQRRVDFTEAALADIAAIEEYIARDSETYAAEVASGFFERAESLGAFAERGRLVPELRPLGLRELLVGNYRMIYGVSPDAVTVLAVVHGSRRFFQAWEERPREEG